MNTESQNHNYNLNVRVTEAHKSWLEATSKANLDCGISKVLRSLIQAEIDHEEMASATTLTNIEGEV